MVVKKIKRNKKSITAEITAEIPTNQWNHLLDTIDLPAPTKLRNRKAQYVVRNLYKTIFARFINLFLETNDEALTWNVVYFIIDEAWPPKIGFLGYNHTQSNYRVKFRIHIKNEENIALFSLTY